MKDLIKNMTILDAPASDFMSSLESGETDIEDSMQFTIAANNGCDLIVTRDKKKAF